MNQKYITSLQAAMQYKGVNIVVGTPQMQGSKWESWWRGNVNSFHFYNIKTMSGSSKRMEKLTMSAPRAVARDTANLVFNDRCTITIDNPSKKDETKDNRQNKDDKILQEILDENNFQDEFRNFVEEYMALGSGISVQYLKDNDVCIDLVAGNEVLITKAKNGVVRGVLVLNITEIPKEKGQKATRKTQVSHYDWDKKTNLYTITHTCYASNSKSEIGKESSLLDIFTEEELDEMVITRRSTSGEPIEAMIQFLTPRPLFQYYKPAIKNNFDRKSPYGVSIFANAIDNFKMIDSIYDAKRVEIKNGKSRVFVDVSLTKEKYDPDKDGYIRYFDEDDTTLIAAPHMKNEDGVGTPIVHVQPDIRTDKFDTALEKEWSTLGANVGLGGSFYIFENGYVTATEVISSNSDTFRNKVAHESVIIKNLEQMAQNIMLLNDNLTSTSYDLDLKKEYIINVKMDDSLIEDDVSRQKNLLEQYNAGVISQYFYLTHKDGQNMNHEQALVEIERTRNGGLTTEEMTKLGFVDTFNLDDEELTDEELAEKEAKEKEDKDKEKTDDKV